MEIRTANIKDFEELTALYGRMCKVLGSKSFMPKGNKGGFPSNEMISDAISKGDQFIGIEDGKIVSAYILNSECDPSYDTAKWKVNAKRDEAVVMHALRVLPEYCRRGYSKALLEHALNEAKNRGMKAVRLDVLEENEVPQKTYLSYGFYYVGTVDITYVDIGEPRKFRLYEYEVKR